MAECRIPTNASRVGTGNAPNLARDAAIARAAEFPPVPGVPNILPDTSSINAQPELVQEYSLRVPKTNTKPISIMRFNGALGVDPSKWTSVKMAREDNSRLHKTTTIVHDEDMPKFGAGSEYGREAREEARRRKFGLNRRKYNPDDQPWVLKLGDKINRKYKGVREGGVSENASYFIFTQAPDGAFEVFPAQQWYNFTPIQRYKSLTSEEAEQEFGRRNKIMNYFSVMVRKRMRNDDGDVEEVEKAASRKGGKKSVGSDLKVSEMDDWADSEDEEMSDEPDEEEEADKKKKKKPVKGKPKKKKKGSDDEGAEDSDDGDGEGRELDYISDTSGSESESEKQKEVDIQGVDQEQAMKHLLESGSDSEENPDKEDEEEKEDEPGPNSKNGEETETKDKKKKKKKKKKSEKKDTNSTENLSDDDDHKGDVKDEPDAAADSIKLESGSSGNNSGNSRDGTPDMDGVKPVKRKASSDLSSLAGHSKKPKMEVSSVLVQSAAAEGITEEAVRRYLLRKPMTVTELLHKFKSKKTKISSQDMVNVIAHILKKINPVKRVQNQKMYLYLTANKS